MRRPCPDLDVWLRRELPSSTDPAYASLLPIALLTEVAGAAACVEVVLDYAHDLRRRNSQDVPRYDISRRDRIIDDEHRQFVTPRSVHPDQLAILEQTFARLRRV